MSAQIKALPTLSKTDLALEGPRDTAPDRAYQRLAGQIQSLIDEGEFSVGERLPSERALAERFEVSRTSVREAIIALELQGVVEVRVGSGIYVSRKPSTVSHGLMLEVGPGPFELLRARSLIEAEVAFQAAQSRKDSDLDQIFGALAQLRTQLHDKDATQEADRLFHLRIAEATGNSVLRQMVAAMWDHARAPIWSQMESHFHSPELRQASHDDHERIFANLLARNPEGARTAMRDHIERVIGEFARAWR